MYSYLRNAKTRYKNSNKSSNRRISDNKKSIKKQIAWREDSSLESKQQRIKQRPIAALAKTTLILHIIRSFKDPRLNEALQQFREQRVPTLKRLLHIEALPLTCLRLCQRWSLCNPHLDKPQKLRPRKWSTQTTQEQRRWWHKHINKWRLDKFLQIKLPQPPCLRTWNG